MRPLSPDDLAPSKGRSLTRPPLFPSDVHDNALIHTDLKPENILLERIETTIVPSRVRPRPLALPRRARADELLARPSLQRNRQRKILTDTGIQLIDFGSATFEGDYHATVVSTRHYRAPEIILSASARSLPLSLFLSLLPSLTHSAPFALPADMGWSYPCDMWSIGCILVEFVTGEALFQTHDNLEHLAMMEKVFGPMPTAYATEAQRCVAFSPTSSRRRAPSGLER